MTNLQWDTYRHRAEAFMLDYLHVRDEKGEAHSFWDRFFEIFGLQRIRYANHEARVKRDGNRQGFIDLLWKGKLLDTTMLPIQFANSLTSTVACLPKN